MSQPHMARGQWLFQNSVDSEHLRQGLQKEQRQLATERRKFEREREEFRAQRQVEEQRLAQQARLFEMKWKILEDELKKLAQEKQEIAQERKKYYQIERERQYDQEQIQGEMFFSGVDNELAMRKRYRDLIKIYHPDNLDGDTQTLQAINQEYDELKKLFCG